MATKLTTNVDEKELRATKFPADFNVKVDMNKVSVLVIKKWVADQITNILHGEDDIVLELIYEALDTRYPNIKALQMRIKGFLDKDAAKFCAKLWSLCISATKTESGVPQELLDAAKDQLLREKEAKAKAIAEAEERDRAERRRDEHIDNLRQRDRAERQSRYSYDRPREPYRRTSPRYDARPDHYAADRRERYPPRNRDSRDDRPRRRSPSRDARNSSSSRSRSRSPPVRKRRRNTSSDDDDDADDDNNRRRPYKSGRDRSRSRSWSRSRSRSRSRSPPRRADRSLRT